jgi:hypothetical protein
MDQTVTVRRALLAPKSAGQTWRQKVQQLALMRDPNFLNILDVIIDKSGAFVISERSRGRSMADLLKERFNLLRRRWLFMASRFRLKLLGVLPQSPSSIS